MADQDARRHGFHSGEDEFPETDEEIRRLASGNYAIGPEHEAAWKRHQEQLAEQAKQEGA